jgi:hypothetical protein
MQQPITLLNRYNLPILGVVAGIVVAVVISLNLPRLSAAYSLASQHRPEAYTELYFADPAHLPSYAPPGKAEKLQFVIVNHEGTSHRYQYVITETAPGYQKQLVSPSFVLADGSAATRSTTYSLPAANANLHITITLLGSGQTLTMESRS